MIMETDFSRPIIREKEIYIANGIKYSAKDIGLGTQGELYFFSCLGPIAGKVLHHSSDSKEEHSVALTFCSLQVHS